jgi:hypothetical protein
MTIHPSGRIVNTIRRRLHITPLAFLRPKRKRSAAAWFAGLREREQNQIEIERQKIADIEARIKSRQEKP